MTGPKTRPLPTVGKQACDRLLKRLLGALRRLTALCDKVETARAKKPAPRDDEKVEIHLELTRLDNPQTGFLIKQEATKNIHLIQEQLRQLRELSLADIVTSAPQDTAQATVGDDFSETQAAPAV
ncbi:hypothetical protein SARC_07826 [Sphaeroforma arctica JP610]|uniref:Uncharacterized protein n=1 Tax=Sphaeroforma arctica JP610 TaxID=667725 RepID=A0A0L0FSP2_9EUKA|nr:hypothetical protein SARC_07826 [Sphaeroforma arctica JP610]KNC79800.1 hypothetical protein SARC_07826 [Sphaeroforma arctica JP610]|eukprot:XP_014153702.1 hypothetical protein SARC_07826 [Sphaeroforma arctica JP610]